MSESKWYELSEGNEKKFSLEELKFTFGQSEKFLKQTFDTSAIIVTRSTILLTTFITVSVSDFVYIISQLTRKDTSNEIDYHIVFTASILLIYFLFLASKAINNVKSYDYKSIGNDPKDLLHDHFPYTETDEKEREKYFYVFTIKDLKTRIDHNNNINKGRWGIYNNILWHIQYVMPIVLLLSYILSYLLTYIWNNYVCSNCYTV